MSEAQISVPISRVSLTDAHSTSNWKKNGIGKVRAWSQTAEGLWASIATSTVHSGLHDLIITILPPPIK